MTKPMTPEQRVELLERLYQEGGEDALERFANSNPIAYLRSVEAIYVVERDVEGLEQFQAMVSRACDEAIEHSLTQDGFAVWERVEQFAREQGETQAAERIAAFITRKRN